MCECDLPCDVDSVAPWCVPLGDQLGTAPDALLTVDAVRTQPLQVRVERIPVPVFYVED